jgi:hypothetical protein
MRLLVVASVLALAGCESLWDPHAPKTVVAPETGGAVTVKHGQRLEVRLPEVTAGNEWRPREPITQMVVAVTPPQPGGYHMTPVRSGTETLRFEEVPAVGQGQAQRSIAYEVTVR